MTEMETPTMMLFFIIIPVTVFLCAVGYRSANMIFDSFNKEK